jgi:hypothetical protein
MGFLYLNLKKFVSSNVELTLSQKRGRFPRAIHLEGNSPVILGNDASFPALLGNLPSR